MLKYLLFHSMVYRNPNTLLLALKVRHAYVGPNVPIKCNAFSIIIYVLIFSPYFIKNNMVCFEIAWCKSGDATRKNFIKIVLM